MKIISKIANVALGLVLVGSSVFAQSLDDAKKAIDAEQYQKAKAMLKNLTVTQATKDENFFYLGWTYLQQDHIDSAKMTFAKGITVDPKSALNYVGLGVVAHLNKNATDATTNFDLAAKYTSKKDSKPYIYMGEGLLIPLPGNKAVNGADADAAITALTTATTKDPKDAEAALALGNAYRSQNKSTDAYTAYTNALSLDPKSPAAHVAEGVLWSNAHNFEDGIAQYKQAIALDPNFGPAYREWAETDLAWSFDSRAVAVEKINEGVENYKKYMSLTDESDETLMRYADFLINAGKWKELQEVAAKLSKSAGSNIRAYRYLGYSAYENKDYPAGLNAINNWFAKAEPVRILPRDYLYLGRLQIATGKDTVAGIGNLKKAVQLDSLLGEQANGEISGIYRKQKKYIEGADFYMEIAKKARRPVNDLLNAGQLYYFSFGQKPDSTLLTKADSAFSYAQHKYPDLYPVIYVYRGRIADIRDAKDLTKMAGLAKPYYEKAIELFTKTPPTDTRGKTNFAESYAYMGGYYLYHDKDDAKAMEMYTKARELDPENKQAKFYFDNKAAAAAAPAKKSK
ncbi:MAG: tetratricopeptide repeat protein [Mucilaginibacter sp.]